MSLSVALLLVALAAVAGVVVGRYLGGREAPSEPATALESEAVPAALDAVLPVLGAITLVVGADDRVLRATPAAHATGLLRAGRLGDQRVAALVRAVVDDGRPRQLDLAVGRAEGPDRLLLLDAARVQPGLALVLVDDRTAAARVDEMRRDFVANVSHELKTPVGAIALLGEALGAASDDPEAVRRFAARIGRESHRLSELVRQIIELSRLQDDDPLEAPEAVDVDEVVAESLDRMRVDAAARQIVLARGGEPALHVLGSGRQLAVAVGNLVENAVSYSGPGGRVAVGVRSRDDSVEISVTDDGIGIPEQELGRIFERFYRLDPARSRRTGGSGLGLSIVKHVAATHGGEVTAWSVEGTGSTFTLRLPLYRPTGAPVPEAVAVSPVSSIGHAPSRAQE